MLEIATLKPDFMGFIFYPPSPRHVGEKIADLPLHLLSGNIEKVAVLVNEPLESARELVSRYKFNLVQLHGEESPEYCLELRKNARVIKTFPVMDQLPSNLEDYLECCDFFLFDTRSEKRGGTGKSFNHEILADYKLPKPFFLGGGIGPDFYKPEPAFQHPMLYALDINSRFETQPGIKDIEMIKAFITIKQNNDIRTNNNYNSD